MNVPFVDLKAQYRSIKTEIDQAIQGILDRTEFVNGPTVARFEQGFAALHGTKHAVACGNGTQALHLVLWSLGIGAGDEVILPSHTFFATAEAVNLVGATPVFAEVDERTYTLDPAGLDALVTPRTKAVIAVHLYGQAADLPALKAFCDARGLKLIEDCAQSHCAEINGVRIGGVGVASGFSFYPGKNMGAYGEGGAMLTNDDELARKARMLRDHGMSRKYVHEVWGHNYRMEGFQGAILEVKLNHIEAWTDARRRNARLYNEGLANIGPVQTPYERPGGRHVYHLYIVRVPRRAELMEFLSGEGVSTGLHYPVPLHLQPATASLGGKTGDFPLTERICDEILSLPMYPELGPDQIAHVCESIGRFYTR